jgi:two-component system, OmpR family, sensor histidine kinase BaeS
VTSPSDNGGDRPKGPEREPEGDFDWSGPEFDWPAERERWRARREMWRRRRMAAAGGRYGDRPFRRHRPPFGCIGCAIIAFLIIVGSTGAFVTWIFASIFGFVAPHAGPPAGAGIGIALILLLGIAVSAQAFASYVRPLASLADATRRLADGEPDVRVPVRGPRPVRELASSFNAMAERLDRSRTNRQAMLADVTHELRTPLTVIGGGLEAMLDGVHPMDEDHVAPLLAETQVMDRLLEDLRTLSLAEAGALALHREPADLVEVAGEAVAAQRSVAQAKGVVLSLGGDAALETSVDPVRVREIITNLLTNAIRHTPPGGRVDVTVQAARGEAVIDVRDTGEGIPAADLPHVFNRFQRRADSGGSGLGLTIVRDLAAAHGGSVEATSDGVGLGARFRVRLPIRD